MKETKKFRLYWLGGKTEVIEGVNIEQAFYAAGYGGSAVKALDVYTVGEEPKYQYNTETKQWESIPPPPSTANQMSTT